MTETTAAARAGHTRWGRVFLAAAPALLVVLLLAGSLFTGLMAATFALGGVPIEVRASQIDVTGMGLYGESRDLVAGDPINVAAAGIEEATITGLCAAIAMPVGGGFNVVLSAPDDVEVDASNLQLDATHLNASLSATDLEVGGDASQLERGNVTGRAGTDAVQLGSAVIGGADIDAQRLSAGTINIGDLTIAVTDEGC